MAALKRSDHVVDEPVVADHQKVDGILVVHLVPGAAFPAFLQRFSVTKDCLGRVYFELDVTIGVNFCPI